MPALLLPVPTCLRPYCFLALVLAQALGGQPLLAQELSRDERKAEKRALRDADKHLKYEEFRFAIPHLRAAQAINPQNPETNYHLGKCYTVTGQWDSALVFLEQSWNQDSTQEERQLELYAKALHSNERWDDAAQRYLQLAHRHEPTEVEFAAWFMRKKQCERGKQLAAQPVNVVIENPGEAINSPFPDFGPVITADESVMIFTSRRDSNYGGLPADGSGFFYEDLYIAERVDGAWQPARLMNDRINSKTHDASIALSADGQQLFLYRDNSGGDIYISELEGEQWSRAREIGKPINNRGWQPSVSLSADRKHLFFVSDGHDPSRGQSDIYVCFRQQDGGWGEPQNLGPAINTPFAEDGPFIHPDGKTLYFSSKGHNGMGGFDIYKSIWQPDGSWSKPENLGYPINTPQDDIYFVMTASGKVAYLASSRANSLGEKDIYRLVFRRDTVQALANRQQAPDLELEIGGLQSITMPEPARMVTLVKGRVYDSLSQDGLQAELVVVDNETGQEVTRLNSNSSSGRYLVTLPVGKNYGLSVTKDGYLPYSENFNTLEADEYTEIVLDIPLQSLAVGAKMVLENIFFDFDKATIRAESEPELKRAVDLLTKAPDLRVRINGHTDKVGGDAYNLDLSQRRAEAVRQALIERGIAPERLEAKGFGETQPVADNSTEEGRQRNRRIEFEVIE